MSDDLYRVESAVSATASGNLTWDRWPYDVAMALGFSGQRNPLGFSMVRYISDQNSAAVWGVVLALATEMVKKGADKGSARELAFQAFEFWNEPHCPRCGGRGITGIEQQLCMHCNGSGGRPISDCHDSIRCAVSLLIEAQQWMDGQLASRLKRVDL